MVGKRRSEARQQGMLDTEETPRQAGAIIHVENKFHGLTAYTVCPPNDNPAAGGTAGPTRENTMISKSPSGYEAEF